jgi:nicotinate-nucleotide adenylyltransferase
MTASPPGSGRGQKVGILGGTFDPIHLGHLRMAERLREMFSLDRFLFVPSAIPPHKPRDLLSPAPLRLAMVQAATAGHPAFEPCGVEVDRGGVSYSIETLDALRARFGAGAELYFAMGDDAFAEVETWKDWQRLFQVTNVVVVIRSRARGERELPVEARDSFCYSPQDDSFRHVSGMRVLFREVGALPISSTEIRALTRAGRSIRYLVPESVREIIERHGLYKAPGPGAG